MDRIYRLSIPGLMFFGSLAFFSLSINGINLIQDFLEPGSNAYEVIAVVLSSPFIGFIIGTFVHAFVDGLLHYKFLLPRAIDPRVVDHLWSGVTTEIKTDIDKKTRKALRNFYLRYQRFLRQSFNEETIQWIARRWTTFYIHANDVIAIIFAFIVACCQTKVSNFNNLPVDIFGYTLIVGYIVCAIVLAIIARHEAIQVEYLAVQEKCFGTRT